MENRKYNELALQFQKNSDRVINYFLICFFVCGFLLAFYYDTWMIAFGIGSLSLIAYYSTKLFLPESNLYQYVLSAVMGIFMAQYIYQMHGMFEMHFLAFIGSAILITYRNWKLQIPLAIVVIVHHAIFGYLQYEGFDKIYFTQLEYMDVRTFVIHGFLSTFIFFLSGLWAHNFKIAAEKQAELTEQIRQNQQQITAAVITAQENERTFLGRELHDNINPTLATAMLFIDSAVGNNDKRIDLMKESKGFINLALNEIRDLSKSLIPQPMKAISLKDTVRDMLNNIKQVNNHRIVTKFDNLDEDLLSDNLKLTIYRIIQEQVNNILKHAHAKTIFIRLTQEETELQLKIKDDGIGFDMSKKRNGVGLQNIISRTELFDGTVVINSAPAKGCELVVRFNVEVAEPAIR